MQETYRPPRSKCSLCWGGVPHPVMVGGVPHPVMVGGGTPSSHDGGGYPIQSWWGVYPRYQSSRPGWGVPHPVMMGRFTQGTLHHSRPGWGVPHPVMVGRGNCGYPPPPFRPGWGGTPSSHGGTPGTSPSTIQTWLGGYPIQSWWGGGTLGNPPAHHPDLAMRYPIQSWGVPWVPPTIQTWPVGYPFSHGWGYPGYPQSSDLGWGTAPTIRPGMGYLLPPSDLGWGKAPPPITDLGPPPSHWWWTDRHFQV